MMNDVLREAVECGKLGTVLEGACEGVVMKDVLREARKSGVLSQVLKHCYWDEGIFHSSHQMREGIFATTLVRAAIECGMLKDVLREALDCRKLETVLQGAREGDAMKYVLVEAKKSGLLSQVVKHCDWYTATLLVGRAIECGMLKDVLREAVECGKLEPVLERAREGVVMKDVLVEAKKSGVLSQVLKHCYWNDGTLDGFYPMREGSSATTLVRAAIECGMLKDVLREALDCRKLGTVLEGAREGDVMKDVLVEAKKSGVLSQVLKHRYWYVGPSDNYYQKWEWISPTTSMSGVIECGMLKDVQRKALDSRRTVLQGARKGKAKKSGLLSQFIKNGYWYFGRSSIFVQIRRGIFAATLVRAAIECGMLNDVLREVLECGTLGTVLEGAHETYMMKDVLVEAKKSGLLSQVVEHCDWYTATSLVGRAIECGMLKDVLREAVECGNVGTLLIEAREEDVMEYTLVEASKAGVLSQVLRHCDCYTATSLVGRAIECGMLKDVLRECGNVGTELIEARKEDVMEDALVEATKSGVLSQVELGIILAMANASGYLRRMLMVMRRFNISRHTMIQTANKEGILQKVLKYVIQLFEVINVILAYILLSVTLNARSKGKGHCSSEHRKQVIDHVTIRSGDIEANPGPVFYFNDWLKEMFALAVRTVHGLQGKNIRWRELGIPNPNNGLDRTRLYALFREHAQTIREAESLIPSTHTKEFQLLKKYIRTGRKPDSAEELNKLEELVKKRNAKVIMQEALLKLQSLSSSAQREVVQCLDTQQLGLLQIEPNTNLRPERGGCSSPETDSGLSASAGSSDGDGDQDISGQSESRDETPSSSDSMSPDLCDVPHHLPDALANFVLEKVEDQATSPVHLQEVITNPSTSNLSTPERTPSIVRQTVVDDNQSPSSNGKLEVFVVGMMKLLYETSPQVMPRMLQTVMELSEQFLNDSTGGSGHIEDKAIESSDARGNECCDTQDLMAILTGCLHQDDQLNDHKSRKRSRNSDLGKNSAKVPRIN